MAGGFFRKWFGQPSPPPAPPPPPPPSPEVLRALADLEQLARARPELAGPAEMIREVLPRLFDEPVRTALPGLTPDRARTKLSAGVPLLQGESFHLDEAAFRHHWERLSAAVEHHLGGDAGKQLREALREGRLNPGEMLGHLMAGRIATVHADAEAVGLDPGLASTVLRLLLIPVLAPINAALTPWRQGAPWQSGSCPVCGGWPLLGELRGPHQFLFLRCGLCTAAWEFPRSACPVCGLDDERFLGSFGVEGGDVRYRARTCAACRHYVKTVTTPAPLSGPQLLVADLTSMALDAAAPGRGYSAAE